MQSIKEFPEPKDKKELGRFLGMVNFYREFIKDMAELAEPLNRLRREGQPFEWDAVCKTAFRKLCEALVSPPVLIFTDWQKPFYLECDASDVSVGGTLAQKDEASDVLKPIGYFSNALNGHQRNYCAREKEAW